MAGRRIHLRGWQKGALGVLPLLAIVALILANFNAPAHAATGGGNSQHDTGEDSQELVQSLQDFAGQRSAPAVEIPNGAWPAAAKQMNAMSVASAGTAWTEVGPYNYFTDDPNYADPNFSNAGSGNGYASGRITALAALSDGQTIFAGGADGGVWKSTDGGAHWKPVFEQQDTLAVGALAIDEQASSYTVYVGTGEANTNADSYAGIGILKSTDGGQSWAQVGGSELTGATIYKILVDAKGGRLYAATSHGLYRCSTTCTAWQRILGTDTTNIGTTAVANIVSDVVIRPGTSGATADIVAVRGWRNGASTNGLYESTNGGESFTAYNPQGYVSPNSQGRVSLAYASDGSKLYAVVQDPAEFNVPGANTNLAGVFVSNSGSPQGPFNKIADSSKLSNSGSAMKIPEIGKGYQPGVQAWYDQFIAVDPSDANHIYVGLEEVYETTNGGTNWTTLGPYWNFPFACFSYSQPNFGNCPSTTHSDQHAITIANGRVWVGNDGGVWSRSLSAHTNTQGSWTDLNQTLNTLQFYYAGAGQASKGGPLTIYGGLQDNGTAKVIPGQLATEPFGGDGGDVIVDPANPDNVMTEYTDLTIAKSTNGGHSWTSIAPNDPTPRFIAPFSADTVNRSHLVAGGEFVWTSAKGFGTQCNATTCDWKAAYDTGAGNSITALDSANDTIYAAWCGPCNPSLTSGKYFAAGIATNYGGTWHVITPPLTSRYVSAVTVDPANPAHVYVTYSSFSRKWIIGPEDPGVGHVFETSDGGSTWSDISGSGTTAILDAPANDVVIVGNHLVVATDLGVFVAATGQGVNTAWQRLGTNLPKVVVNDLSVAPDGTIVAATHGRGLWTFPSSALPKN